MRRCFVVTIWALTIISYPQSPICAAVAPANLKVVVPAQYLPQVPLLVRVEAMRVDGGRQLELWDAEATLSANSAGVSLSTNRVHLRNGLGSALVSVTGSGDFQLSASLGASSAAKVIKDASASPVTTAGGTLPAGDTVWSGVIQITSTVTVPAGATLTILSNSLVLVPGPAGVTNNLVVNGTLRSLGTEDHPVSITCSTPGQRWGQIRHNNAQPSLYRFTSINRAGRGTGEGHTTTTPVIRPTNSKITFESCNLTDFADPSGGPGKVGFGTGADLTFNDCLLQRARMGPEVSTTALLCTNTWIMDMLGPDDADGIYVHDQAAGQQVLFAGCVVADGDDDGIDTLGSVITVEDCIIREWNNLGEDAKGISALNGSVHVRRSLIVDSTVGIAAKSGGSAPSTTPVLVTIENTTMMGNRTNLLANRKSSAVGPNVHMNLTNCILWGGDPIHSEFDSGSFDSTNFTVTYCNVGEPWAGTGNIMADPLFADVGAHNFSLLPHSPSIDAGNPSSPPDPDGSPADQGYLRFSPPRPSLSSSGVAGSAFQFVLTAYTNRNYVVEFSSDLKAWSFLKTVAQTAENLPVSDTSVPLPPDRFYRVHLAP